EARTHDCPSRRTVLPAPAAGEHLHPTLGCEVSGGTIPRRLPGFFTNRKDHTMSTQSQPELSKTAENVPQGSPATASSEPRSYVLDPAHTEIGFKVRHMMVSWTRGLFGSFEGTVEYDAANPEGISINVSVDVESIDTKAPDRDKHLRSADFFDVENHPKMTFVSRSAKLRGEGALDVEGDLTIRGVTRPITLEVRDLGPLHKDPWGNLVRGAEAKARISRKDFGLNWNTALETGGVLVGDEVHIEVGAELKAASQSGS